MAARIDRLPELGYKIAGFVTEDTPSARLNANADHPILGGLRDIKSILENGTSRRDDHCLPVREHVGSNFRDRSPARRSSVSWRDCFRMRQAARF